MNKREYKTIIIGAGASGLMLGTKLEKDFIILEKNAKVGAKIAISGGGRCNFTNESVSADNYLGDSAFVDKVISAFTVDDMLSLARKWNVPFVVQKNRQFFCKDSAMELLVPMTKSIESSRISLNTEVLDVEYQDGMFKVESSKGAFYSKKLVVASGGLSYSSIGATDVGYRIAQKFGHKITPCAPALVGFTVQPGEAWFKELSGVSVFARVTVGGKSFEDNILFAHKGISGPAILNASLYWKKGSITIDFLPNLDIDKALAGGIKQVTTVLGLPKRVTKAYLDFSSMQDKPIDKLTQDEKDVIARLKNYQFPPAGTFGYTKAEITKGGVCTDEVDADTMESRLQKGLYFLGEVLDVSGELGGYNFHFAFASAIKCVASVK